MNSYLKRVASGLLALLIIADAAAEQIYVRANQPTASRYTPATTLAGRIGARGSVDVQVSRSAVGSYAISFGGTLLSSSGGNVQVSANDENGRYCKILNWGSGAANVRCFAANGRPADASFTVLATRASGRTPGMAYAWVAKGIPPRVASNYSYAEGGAASVQRTRVGRYRVSLPGIFEPGGNVQVTAYGADANYCNVHSWNPGRTDVSCYNSSGAPVDSSFSVLATDSRYTPAGGRVSYLWANNQSALTYEPHSQHAKSEIDDPVIRRRARGQYQVTVGPIVSGGGGVQLTAYGSSARCAAAGWAGGSIAARCFAADGSPVDSRFSVLAVRDAPIRILNPDLPVSVDVPVMAPTPTIQHQINVVEHLCINTTCEYGSRGWDKTPSERAHDGTDETTFEVDVAGSRLIRLCPVRRRTTDEEFAGNGPAVRANTEITQSGQTLQLSAFMEAQETGSGSSIAFKTWTGDLYKAPAGWRISDFTPVRSETSYTDSNHSEDVPAVRGGSLVSEFRFKGDTGGNDIGNCTADDTYMTVTYNPVAVTLSAQRGDLREVRIERASWVLVLDSSVVRLAITINNYDRTKSQPENGTPENKYFIDRTDPDSWPGLTDAEIRQASFYEYRPIRGFPAAASVPATPLPVPAIQRNTFTFLLNNIVANGRGNRVAPAGDHIRLTIPFESNEAEVVTACVDNAACGTGEPHEAGKPIVQVNNMRIIPYLRPRVDRGGLEVRIRAELARVRLEADISRDGTCRNNFFAFACGALAGNIERIAYEAVLDQLNAFVASSAGLLNLLDDQLTDGFCQLLQSRGENCQRLENIVLDENGDLLLWMRE